VVYFQGQLVTIRIFDADLQEVVERHETVLEEHDVHRDEVAEVQRLQLVNLDPEELQAVLKTGY